MIKKAIKTSLLFVLLFIQNLLFGQKKEEFSNSKITFTSDNDFFLLSGSDRYYTNGLFFSYSTLAKKKPTSILKKINRIELGQQIYNAYKRKIEPEHISEIDRPIAAYLYVSYAQYRFISSRSLWYWAVIPGIVGPGALGKEVQSGWHGVIGIKTKWDWVWKYQIRNEAGLNGSAGYAFSFIKNPSSHIQLSSESEVTLGSILDNASQSLTLQFGKFNTMHESVLWNADPGNKISGSIKSSEIFFFYKPTIEWQVYNATIQGGLFNHDKGPIVSDIQPFILYNNLGVTAASFRYSATFKLVFQTRECRNQLNNHLYGSISLSYLFK